MIWRTVDEHIVADVFRSKKISTALLVHVRYHCWFHFLSVKSAFKYSVMVFLNMSICLNMPYFSNKNLVQVIIARCNAQLCRLSLSFYFLNHKSNCSEVFCRNCYCKNIGKFSRKYLWRSSLYFKDFRHHRDCHLDLWSLVHMILL